MRAWFGTFAALFAVWMLVAGAAGTEVREARGSLLIVRGADGNDEFARLFDDWESHWKAAAVKGGLDVTTVGADSAVRAIDELQQALRAEDEESERPLWIVLIGHGTFDGRAAKFNLVGPDVTAEELAAWLQPIKRPLAVINCASASAPFLDRLSQPQLGQGQGRIIVTATKSGHEVNFARFGGRLARAIDDLAADLDKDGQVSLLEAFLTASRQTQSDYEGLQQLATEHALLDDNGDGRGASADFFEGLRPVKAADNGLMVDGHRAHQWFLVPSEDERRFPEGLRRQRDDLELEIAGLRDRKTQLDETVYYADLERLLVQLAEFYEQADDAVRSDDDAGIPPGEGP